MKRSLFCLTAHDYECIDHTARVHGHIRRADAVRFAIFQQSARSKEASAVRAARPLVEACLGNNAVNPDGKPLRRWHMLVSVSVDEHLNVIMARHGFDHKAEAVRFVVRSQAYADGFGEPAGAPKPRKRKGGRRRQTVE
jgi:hypothetical protein